MSAPRAAYVHVPFCNHRCGYCNFTVVANRLDLTKKFLQAIELELQQLDSLFEVDTLFLGGGTPTELPPDDLRALLDLLKQWLPLAKDYEFSVEANPESFDPARIAILQESGVNRISLGVQSFADVKLAQLDRQHSADVALAAIERATRSFPNVSVDLIFAAPGETLADWQRDVGLAVSMETQHVSTYGLTFEQGTKFGSQLAHSQVAEVGEDLQTSMYQWSIDALIKEGFEHYEVSNFARPGFRCRHNETYWLGQPYFAFGPGASRFVDGRRETNHRSTTTYLKRMLDGQSPVAESETLRESDLARERIVFGCRRLEGIDCAEFEQEFGLTPQQIVGPAIDRFTKLGLLEVVDGRLKLTRVGLLVSDSIWPEFL